VHYRQHLQLMHTAR